MYAIIEFADDDISRIFGLFNVTVLATGETLRDLTAKQVESVIAKRGLRPAPDVFVPRPIEDNDMFSGFF